MPLETVNLAAEKAASAADRATFQPTTEELHTIQEKLKDPKFVELMHDYMQSLQDPETLKEEQAYLEQSEREAREGGDYSFEFIFPRGGFVVELLQPTTQHISLAELKKMGSTRTEMVREARSYVNICSSEKVDEYREEPTGNREGSHWHVPVSVSQKRLDYYTPVTKSGNTTNTALPNPTTGSSSSSVDVCYVYDAVFHPKTISLADRSARFMCFLVEIAVEHINSGYKESNGFEFRRLPSSVISVGQPKNQTVRRQGTTTPFDVDRSKPVLMKPTKHLDETTTTAAASPTAAAQAHRLPPHTIAHRGRVALSDAWQWKVSDSRVGVPEELLVRMTFEKVRRAVHLEIDITEDGTALRVSKTAEQTDYEGILVLPFTVKTEPCAAKFDKSSGVLTLTLTVVPPQVDAATAMMADELKAKYVGRSDPHEEAGDCHGDTTTTAAALDPLPAEGLKADATSLDGQQQSPHEEEDAATEKSSSPPEACATAAATLATVPPVAADPANERAAAMMAKVAAARRAREAAAAAERAAAVAVTTTEEQVEPTSNVDGTTPNPDVSAAVAHTNSAEETRETEHVSSEASTVAAANANAGDCAEIPFLQRRAPTATTPEASEMASLRSRQQAWAALIHEEMANAQEIDETEAVAAALQAENDAVTAKQKLDKIRELEELEAKVTAQMAAVPLRNTYIFAID